MPASGRVTPEALKAPMPAADEAWAAALAAYRSGASPRAELALARAYFPALAAPPSGGDDGLPREGPGMDRARAVAARASDQLTVMAEGGALRLITRGHAFLVEAADALARGSLSSSEEGEALGEGHFLVPVGAVAGAAPGTWQVARVEELY